MGSKRDNLLEIPQSPRLRWFFVRQEDFFYLLFLASYKCDPALITLFDLRRFWLEITKVKKQFKLSIRLYFFFSKGGAYKHPKHPLAAPLALQSIQLINIPFFYQFGTYNIYIYRLGINLRFNIFFNQCNSLCFGSTTLLKKNAELFLLHLNSSNFYRTDLFFLFQ